MLSVVVLDVGSSISRGVSEQRGHLIGQAEEASISNCVRFMSGQRDFATHAKGIESYEFAIYEDAVFRGNELSITPARVPITIHDSAAQRQARS